MFVPMPKGYSAMSSQGALCVITARGGSKRIPRKNIKEFCGKPIIAYSIEAALESGLFDEVMVSTDDTEIAKIARIYGASVPFMRSAKTSDDYATSADVLDEVLSEYETRGHVFDILCCLYPTAPFVTSNELVGAATMLEDPSVPSVVAVTDFDFPPQRAFLLAEDGELSWARPEYALSRSQDLRPTAHDCGRFYFARVPEWRAAHSFVMPDCRGYRIDPSLVQDIDTSADWKIAEMKYRIWQEGKESV